MATTEPRTIGYRTDDPTRDYVAGLDTVGSTADLRDYLAGWPTLAADAIAVAATMTENDFEVFQEGLKKQRKKQNASEEWSQRYVSIVVPEKMLDVSMVARAMGVTWGTAWIRLQEVERDRLAARPKGR